MTLTTTTTTITPSRDDCRKKLRPYERKEFDRLDAAYATHRVMIDDKWSKIKAKSKARFAKWKGYTNEDTHEFHDWVKEMFGPGKTCDCGVTIGWTAFHTWRSYRYGKAFEFKNKVKRKSAKQTAANTLPATSPSPSVASHDDIYSRFEKEIVESLKKKFGDKFDEAYKLVDKDKLIREALICSCH
jgi:hypothetical protein